MKICKPMKLLINQGKIKYTTKNIRDDEDDTDMGVDGMSFQ